MFGENKKARFICEDIIEMVTEEKYDKVIMADVYEHIEQEVIERLLQKISKDILKTDGIMIIHIAPN